MAEINRLTLKLCPFEVSDQISRISPPKHVACMLVLVRLPHLSLLLLRVSSTAVPGEGGV